MEILIKPPSLYYQPSDEELLNFIEEYVDEEIA
jgi:hypothetical protein